MNNFDILFCTTEFPPMPGGIGNHAYGLALELKKKRKIVLQTEIRGSNEKFNSFIKNNLSYIEVLGIPRNRFILYTYISRVAKFIKYANKSKNILLSGKFYVWLASLTNKKSNVIVIIHGSEIKQAGVAKWLFNRGLKSANYIVCVSNYTSEKLIDFYGESLKNKIKTINNGFVIPPRYIELNNQKKQLNIITVGGVHKRKGQQNVIKAIPFLKEHYPNLKYNMVGLPVEKAFMESIAENYGCSENVKFHSAVSEKEKWKLLAESDVFLMLSEELENGDFEGFGIAIIEAMSIGVPAIGTKNSGIADAISVGKSGELVNPMIQTEILQAIDKVMNNYLTYSNNAKEWSESFKWDKVVVKYEELLI